MHVVLRSVVPNGCSDFIFHFGCNGVFRGVHVGDLRLLQSFSELVPCSCFDVVVFTNIQAPNLAFRVLQYSQEVQYLIVPHSFVEILQYNKKVEDEDKPQMSPKQKERRDLTWM